MDVEQLKPYGTSTQKHVEVEQMFDSIAPAYDFMNNAMTAGLCRLWRNKALASIGIESQHHVLDIATGTGDVAFEIYHRYGPEKVVGADISSGMLAKARQRLSKMPESKRGAIQFIKADCLRLPFKDESFDVITIAYGVRNLENLSAGYAEMFRVLRPGGRICVIELSEPRFSMPKILYKFYTRCIIPMLGKIFAGDRKAYVYLPQSIAACPQGEEMSTIMTDAGFSRASRKSYTFGVVTVYSAFRAS